MKVTKKVGGGIPFARKSAYEWEGTKFEADLKNGDKIKILDSGTEEEGTFGKQKNFKIKTRNGEKKLCLNQKTINVLIEEFGDETEDWVNKTVKVILKKDVIANKKVIIPYLVTDGWMMDDYGELVKEDNITDGEEVVQLDSDTVDEDDIPE